MRFAGNKIFVALATIATAANTRGAAELGIDVLESNGYALLKNKSVGLITNQTGIDSRGVRTRVLLRKNCNLIALYTPEHGFDGREKAGRYIRSRRDPVTGLTAHSLYGPKNRQLRTNLIARSKRGKREMFFKCYGSSSIASQFTRGSRPAEIVASWTADVMRFKSERSQYLLY